MKHFKISLVLLGLACALLFSGCSLFAETERTFTSGDLTITLTNRFKESEMEGFDMVFDSFKVAVFVIKEDFTATFGPETTLEQYADLVIEANKFVNVQTKVKDDLTYFEYTSDVDGTEYSYYAFVYKTDNAFWLIQFACESKEIAKQSDKFFRYAKSVTFS